MTFAVAQFSLLHMYSSFETDAHNFLRLNFSLGKNKLTESFGMSTYFYQRVPVFYLCLSCMTETKFDFEIDVTNHTLDIVRSLFLLYRRTKCK